MAAAEEEVSSSAQAEDLWNIAVSTKDESTADVPQKSSNEILTELFGAFNAEPPKSIIASDVDTDNEIKVKKHKKKHKKEKKHKKKSKSKRRLSSEQDNSSIGYTSESENEHEKRKERKHRPKKKRKTKSSDMDSDEEQKPKKRSRHSKSPSITKKETCSDSTQEKLKEEPKECPLEVKKDCEVDKNADAEVSSSTPAPPNSPPPLPTVRKDEAEESSVFDNIKTSEVLDEKSDKAKPVMGKIVIKDLKFSSVFEATVKEVEEQAKAKAEKYEEGELSDTSSQKTSDLSDDHANAPSLGSEGGDAAEPNGRSDDNSKKSKRSRSVEKSSSHQKKSKHRSRSRSKSRSRSRDHDHKSKDKERHCRHKDRDKDKEKDKNKEKDRHKDRDRTKERDKDRNRERERGRDRDRDRDRDKDRKDKDHRDRRRGHSRSRSRSPRSRNRSSSRSRRRHSRERRRTRSRSRDRKRISGGDHIDKKKLLEIARRNAMNMLQAGILPGNILGKTTAPAPSAAAPTEKPEKTAAKTVDELTEYCKELSKRENMGELSSLSGSEESDSEKPFHHPFQVKDRPSFISLNIKNAVQLPLKSMQERTMESSQLRIQFPVSSGQQHRKTENEWIPVTPQTKAEEKKSSGLKAIEAPKSTEKTSQSTSSEVIDIGTLVTQRLSEMRKKHDSEQSQYIDHTYGWNNVLPGQFTGDTGVRLLTPQQLASGAQAWARKAFRNTVGAHSRCLL